MLMKLWNTMKTMIPDLRFFLFLIIVLVFPAFSSGSLQASPDSGKEPSSKTSTVSPKQKPKTEPWHKRTITKIKSVSHWGGHFKLRDSVSWPDSDSIYHLVGAGPAYDIYTEGRINAELYLWNWGNFVCQYQMILFGGSTRQKQKELERDFPFFSASGLMTAVPLNDDRFLMDLTLIIDENGSLVFYNRLDRLYLTLQPKWGFVRIGRQAVTWGSGYLFNPMDLLNPFNPTNIDKDYKVGSDMVYTEITLNKINGDFQLIYVPRRNLETRDLAWDQSALGGKLRFGVGNTGFELMGAVNYNEPVVGVGSTGYVKGAGWRVNGTWTFLDNDGENGDDGYFSLVANVDYYWTWWKKNFYGFIEYYFNSLGTTDYTNGFQDRELMQALAREVIFTLGRNYVSANLKVELTPLLNVFLTAINNVEDPSGILQPRAVWSATEDLQITAGGNIYYGGKNTEYGGIELPFPVMGQTLLLKEPLNAFLWLEYFF